MSAWTTLSAERRDGVAVVTFARPEVLNAIDETMQDELIGALATLGDEHAIVLTGAGRAFMAGADIGGYGAGGRERFIEFQRRGAAMYAAVRECPAIVIAAINGYALGGGLEMALACDVVFAAEDATLGFPEVKLGLLPGGGGTALARRRLPAGVAKDLLLSGRAVSAAEALRIGLVQHVVPAGEVVGAAVAYAARLGRFPASTLREIAALVDERTPWDLDTALADEHAALIRCYDGPGVEGIQAFLDKRPADFRR